MPIPFTCPYCGLQSNVADEFAGRSGPCSRCGDTITIPGPGGGARTDSGGANSGRAGGDRLEPASGAPASLAPATAPKSNVAIVVIILAVVGLGGICVIAMLFALLQPAFQGARTAAQTSTCMNNMKQIALAMHNYHDTYGSFPPAYFTDEDGTPTHSWRVMLLPFLEGEMLYDQYDFDEPWDSPNNMSLSLMMPDVYHCPESIGVVDETSYMVINGPGFLFDGDKSHTMRQIIDGTSNTIMLIEADAAPVNWMAPEDLDWDAAGIDATSSHAGKIHVVFADGSVHLLDEVSDYDLEANLTIGGREPVSIRP